MAARGERTYVAGSPRGVVTLYEAFAMHSSGGGGGDRYPGELDCGCESLVLDTPATESVAQLLSSWSIPAPFLVRSQRTRFPPWCTRTGRSPSRQLRVRRGALQSWPLLTVCRAGALDDEFVKERGDATRSAGSRGQLVRRTVARAYRSDDALPRSGLY